MARNNGRNRKFGRNKPKQDKVGAAISDAVARFPAPEPFPEKVETPKPDFSDNLAVKLNKVEREITRRALNEYVETLTKLSKKMRAAGLPNIDIQQRIAVINGGDGLGQGIYQRLSEQMSIVDEAQLKIQDEERANEAEAVACFEALIGLTEMPAGDIREPLLALVRTWPSNKRTEAIEYCVNVGALAEGDKYQGEIPSQVRIAIDRAIEWTLTAEDIDRFVTMGPWRPAWLEDDAKKVFHYAERPVAEGEPERGDHGLFETEAEARRCVARLNQMASLEPPPSGS